MKAEVNSSSVKSNDVVSIDQEEELSAGISPLLTDLTNSNAEINGIGSHSLSSSLARLASKYSLYVPTKPLGDSETQALLNFIGKQEEIHDELFEQIKKFVEETGMEMENNLIDYLQHDQIASLQQDVDQMNEILEKHNTYLDTYFDEGPQKLPAKRKQSVEREVEGEENNLKKIRKDNNIVENQIESEGSSEATLAVEYQADSARNENADDLYCDEGNKDLLGKLLGTQEI
ncbi:unnamed protein product [Orchesella dallaii]|uniref:Uncharacterized protein n=1 Tax=Orchesella dallaii TaxID=48710 RepID=A0ABP1RMT3_9HEXA